MQVVLTIAGFDPSGGAGVLADIKAIAAQGCFGAAAITSLTYQNTQAVYGAAHQSAETVRQQIKPVLHDFAVAAVKTGMLPTSEIITTVAELIAQHALPNFVLDPVIRATSGFDLIDDAALQALRKHLLPLAAVITPNMAEAERLTGLRVTTLEEMHAAARAIYEACGRAVLVKGGHLPDEATDVFFDGATTHLFRAPRIATRNTHGTGCTLSAAIAAYLARGFSIPEAIARAKSYLNETLRAAPDLGKGHGPLNHFPKL
ncbi:MAG: bifunctional hydroxymethylpyrimidine kinase/phosphomethylpyrimidine kinase [Acidobacteria bacterium]|nr:bifunctional hydroxymethylpyrimidine kinase/phosphomethylpyrimidine kinase [Acidobacteriota bacterium]